MPLENMIKMRELQDENGNIILKLGTCEQVISNDKLPDNLAKIKVRLAKFW